MDQTTQNIKEFLIQLILELSDKEYQERVWLTGEGPEIGSAGEFLCNFFDDLNLEEIIENYKKYEIYNYQLESIKRLYKELQDYSDSIPITPIDREVLRDPRWGKIREFAKEVYSELTGSSAV